MQEPMFTGLRVMVQKLPLSRHPVLAWPPYSESYARTNGDTIRLSGAGFMKEAWQTDGPSGMMVLAHEAGGYKRFRITPTDTSLANFGGGQ